MQARGALLCGALTVALAAGCGSGGHKSTTQSSTTSNAAASGLTSHLLVSNELAGFTGSTPTVATSTATWVSDTGPPPNGTAAEVKRLTRLGFVRGASESMTGGSTGTTGGLSAVEQFRSPKDAQAEVDYEADSFKSFPGNAGSQFKTWAIPGIPGARGYGAIGSGGGGINIGFAKGTYAYIVGQHLPSSSSYSARVQKLIAAAQHLYGRVSP